MKYASDHRLKAAGFALLAVGMASTQDAIIKAMSANMPAYETVLLRGLLGMPILAGWQHFSFGLAGLRTGYLWPLLLRGVVLCSAYFAFILAIAAMPIANVISIYFTMPFFVAALAGPFLHEKVPVYRWLAMIAGFMGVVIMVRPGSETFEPASFFALYSAFGYAVGQMMGRHYAQSVPPLTIANVQNLVYLVVALLVFATVYFVPPHWSEHKSLQFLTRPFLWPNTREWLMLSLMVVFAAVSSVVYTSAYKNAPASFVAPFEYSAMLWAVAYGLMFFGDFPDFMTWVGIVVVMSAGLLMAWRDSQTTG